MSVVNIFLIKKEGNFWYSKKKNQDKTEGEPAGSGKL